MVSFSLWKSSSGDVNSSKSCMLCSVIRRYSLALRTRVYRCAQRDRLDGRAGFREQSQKRQAVGRQGADVNGSARQLQVKDPSRHMLEPSMPPPHSH